MRRRPPHLSTARVLAAAVVAAGALLLSVMPAIAGPGDPLDSGDPRATAYPGNIQANKDGCATAGLAGDVILEDGDPSGTYFDLPEIPEGVTLTGVVVKGGDAYNVYVGSDPELMTDLHAPINPSGGPAGLSHWFACGTEEEESSTTTTTESTTSSEQTTSSGTAAGGAVGGGAVGGAGLAETGAAVGPSLLVAGLLVLLGAGLVLASRRRAFGRR